MFRRGLAGLPRNLAGPPVEHVARISSGERGGRDLPRADGTHTKSKSSADLSHYFWTGPSILYSLSFIIAFYSSRQKGGGVDSVIAFATSLLRGATIPKKFTVMIPALNRYIDDNGSKKCICGLKCA